MVKSFILRPNETISSDFSLSDETFLTHELIDETQSDEDETYIYVADEEASDSADINGEVRQCIIGLDEAVMISNLRVLSVDTIVNARVELSNGDGEITILYSVGDKTFYGGVTRKEETTSWSDLEFYMSAAGVDEINSLIQNTKTIPRIFLTVEGKADADSENKDLASCRVLISQVFVKVYYEEVTDIGIYDKINGKQKAATAAYQKLNGTWSEISEDEAKTILKNNTIRRG